MHQEPSDTLSDLAAELDRAHDSARAALRARDLSTYVKCFAPELAYRDAKGRAFTREQIGRQVHDQLQHLVAADSRFDRHGLVMNGPLAVETGTQTARMAVRIAGVFARRWSIYRRGTYTWRRDPHGWVILGVDLLEEKVTGDGFSIAKADMYDRAV